MRVLAIDPGNSESGFVIWDGKQILDKGKLNNFYLQQCIEDCFDFDVAVIEMISSYGMPVGQTTFDTCVWIGRFIETLLIFNKKSNLIFRPTVKMHHCHRTTKVPDPVINRVLKDKYGERHTKKNPNPVYWNEHIEKNGGDKSMNGDIWAAFALATYWTEPHDHPIKNEKEQERNKLTPNLL